jgi:hypothetical protein
MDVAAGVGSVKFDPDAAYLKTAREGASARRLNGFFT